jgi:hypothetical protein
VLCPGCRTVAAVDLAKVDRPSCGGINRAFFTACSKAQAAADDLRGLALRDQ